MADECFHCKEAIPETEQALTIRWQQQVHPVCCHGCKAVAETIIEQGLDQYYQFRTEQPLIPSVLHQQNNTQFDQPHLLQQFTQLEHAGTSSTTLAIEGMHCSACAWLIEHQLQKTPGLVHCTVNASTHRAVIEWQQEVTPLSEFITTIQKIGYNAYPLQSQEIDQRNKQQAKQFLIRIGVSGLLTMQLMMVAFGLYFGADGEFKQFFHWVSLLISIPILAYAALPFLTSAWQAVRLKHLNMDVPVALALYGIFFASAYATITNQGAVYFESIGMFTFLLLIGRFLEFKARQKAILQSTNLLRQLPATARKITATQPEIVPVSTLIIDDHLLIKPGDTIPIDAIVIKGHSSTDESILTGEQTPVKKVESSILYAGTVNHDGVLEAKVSCTNENTRLQQIVQLQQQSLSHKPRITQLTDTIAHWFVLGLLVIAAMTALYWSFYDPDSAFWITISVLVATCPCALSLATPMALTCANGALAKLGVLVKKSHVLETLPQVDSISFDKTGTLTQGQFQVTEQLWHDKKLKPTLILNWIANLEQFSEHPIAQAFVPFWQFPVDFEQVVVTPGQGISGELRYQQQSYLLKIGSASFTQQAADPRYQVFILLNTHCVAQFELSDPIRQHTKSMLTNLHQLGLQSTLLTGDSSQLATDCAQQVGIHEHYIGCDPQQKLNHLNQLKSNQKITAMVGDGINDSPVMNAAHVSIVMENGADLTKYHADVILMQNNLAQLPKLFMHALRTKKIMQQNLSWALLYNLCILPLAVSGQVLPYIAVIGMSLSSLLVISNSLRLLKP